MRIVILCLAAIVLPSGAAFAVPEKAQQFVAESWHGLSGLYVIPTARTLDQGQLALSYSESKHIEYIGSIRFSDRQVRAAVTYGVTDRLEIYGAYCRYLMDIGDNYIPQMGHQTFEQFGLKYRFIDEDTDGWRPALAIAVRDLGNDLQDIDPLPKVNNGRKWFLLASKRLVEKEDGRFLDFHLGATSDELTTAGLFGLEMAFTTQTSLIAEGMWDSPYMNFTGIYGAGPKIYGNGDQDGKFIFDLGFRLYPDLVPGLTADLGFVGDSTFNFSFGVGYVLGL